MSAISSPLLFEAWEECHGTTHSDVAVRLLCLVAHTDDVRALAALSIGARDRQLMSLRQLLFGSEIELRTECPTCHEQLEIDGLLDEFNAPYVEADAVFEISDGDDVVAFRAPTSFDVAAAMIEKSPAQREASLWARCVSFWRSGVPHPPSEVHEALARQVDETLAELDAQAVGGLELSCPACDHVWHGNFDIVPILWTELDAHVRRELHAVHRLAASYGWDEATVLALSPRRRQFYLEQV